MARIRRTPFAGPAPLLEQFLAGGFLLLADSPDQELVLGTVGQFWKLRGGPVAHVSTAREFGAFYRADHAKAALNISVHPWHVDQGVRLRTETRVHIVDPGSRRRFARYWRVISSGSALIRRQWLLAIKTHAETLAHLG